MSPVNHTQAFKNRVVGCRGVHAKVFEMIQHLVEELGQAPTPEEGQMDDPCPRKYTFLAGGTGKRWLAVMFPKEEPAWFEHLGKGHISRRRGMAVRVQPKKNSPELWTQVRFSETYDAESLSELADELREAHDAVLRLEKTSG